MRIAPRCMLVMERGAATHFAVLIDGGFGPEPHPSFIEVFGEAALDDSDRALEGAWDPAGVIVRVAIFRNRYGDVLNRCGL
jgi:hypothetical protein